MATERAIAIVSQWEDIRGDGTRSDLTRIRIMVSMLDELRDEIRREQDEPHMCITKREQGWCYDE